MQEKLSKYHEIITGAWKYLKYLLEKNDSKGKEQIDWAEVIELAEEFTKQHGNDEFASKIIVNCMSEFERIKKNEKRPD